MNNSLIRLFDFIDTEYLRISIDIDMKNIAIVPPGHRWIVLTKASNAESVFMSLRRYDMTSV